jgi:hypothetical protein
MFDHDWSNRTSKLVRIAQRNWIRILHDECVKQRKFAFWDQKLMPMRDELHKHAMIYDSLDVDDSIKR